MTIETAPATATRWNDLEVAFGPRAADATWCWCRRFLDPDPDVADPRDNRGAPRHEIAMAQVPPGLIGYIDGVPAGWTRVMPRDELPGVVGNRALRRFLDEDPGVWWVTCFAVDHRHRSIGLATASAGGSRFPCWSIRRDQRAGSSSGYRRPQGEAGWLRPVHRNDETVRRSRLHRDRTDLPEPPGDATRSFRSAFVSEANDPLLAEVPRADRQIWALVEWIADDQRGAKATSAYKDDGHGDEQSESRARVCSPTGGLAAPPWNTTNAAVAARPITRAVTASGMMIVPTGADTARSARGSAAERPASAS